MPPLADTSMWVDALRNHDSSLEQMLDVKTAFAYTEPILMEILMGARNPSDWRDLRRFIIGAHLIPFESVADFEAGAHINRRGRAHGITLGKFDCLILAVTQRTGATLMTRDRRQVELGHLIGVTVVSV